MTLSTAEIAARYHAVLARVEAACARVGRAAEEVTVVAVSKSQPVEVISSAVEAGCLDFGENRVQEWRDKHVRLSRRIRWHFIGRLQRNKVKYLVDEITLVHSLDSVTLVEELERRAESAQEVLIQVNVGDEPQKGGVDADGALALALQCASSPIVRPVGLMCIPPHFEDPEVMRPFYRGLAELRSRIQAELSERDELIGADFRHLSMGMSGDFEVAVEEGATLIRVGTSILGPRSR